MMMDMNLYCTLLYPTVLYCVLLYTILILIRHHRLYKQQGQEGEEEDEDPQCKADPKEGGIFRIWC